MASRRIISTEKTILDKDDETNPPNPAGAAERSSVAPEVPMGVILKLLGFTLAMIVVPIGSYFATVDTLFRGNSTYAGALAAITANVVLIAYVIVAWKEDESERRKENEKKTR